jgi:hypothetical protein
MMVTPRASPQEVSPCRMPLRIPESNLRGSLCRTVSLQRSPSEQVHQPVVVVQRRRASIDAHEHIGAIIHDLRYTRAVAVSAVADHQLSWHPKETPKGLVSVRFPPSLTDRLERDTFPRDGGEEALT